MFILSFFFFEKKKSIKSYVDAIIIFSLTIAPKYTLLWGTNSLSLNKWFLDRRWRHPQSITRSQYVETIVAMAKKIQANVFQPIPLSRL